MYLDVWPMFRRSGVRSDGCGNGLIHRGGTVRTPPRALAGTAAGFLAAAIVLTASSGGNAAPATPAQAPTQKVQGDDHHEHVVDNRQGRVAPTTGQRAAAVGTSARWNALGT